MESLGRGGRGGGDIVQEDVGEVEDEDLDTPVIPGGGYSTGEGEPGKIAGGPPQ